MVRARALVGQRRRPCLLHFGQHGPAPVARAARHPPTGGGAGRPSFVTVIAVLYGVSLVAHVRRHRSWPTSWPGHHWSATRWRPLSPAARPPCSASLSYAAGHSVRRPRRRRRPPGALADTRVTGLIDAPASAPPAHPHVPARLRDRPPLSRAAVRHPVGLARTRPAAPASRGLLPPLSGRPLSGPRSSPPPCSPNYGSSARWAPSGTVAGT